MLSYPSIQLAKRHLGTIHEAIPPHTHSISFSHPLPTSRSGSLGMSSESAVIISNPPSTSPYSPYSMTFDQPPEALVGLEAPDNFPLSMSLQYGHDSELEEPLLPPLPPLAVSAFPRSPPRKSRSKFLFPRIPDSVSRIISRSPAIFDAETIYLRSAPRSAKAAYPSPPGRFQTAIKRIKAFF